jgi:hypothetical protein
MVSGEVKEGVNLVCQGQNELVQMVGRKTRRVCFGESVVFLSEACLGGSFRLSTKPSLCQLFHSWLLVSLGLRNAGKNPRRG